MKKINKLFALLVVVAVVSSCGGNKQHSEEEALIEVSTENLTIANYAIEGMVCAMGCAATIEKDVGGLNGVVISEVDYEAGKAHFEFDGSLVSEKDIIAKIEELADGQYKVEEWNDKGMEDDGESESSEKSTVEVSLPSFEIPNLFHLLMNQL